MSAESGTGAASEPEAESPGDLNSRRNRAIFLGVWGSILVGLVFLFRDVLLPFVLAVLVAYVLAPLVGLLERARIGRVRIPRWVAVITLYSALLGLLSLFASLGVPRLAAEIEKLARDAPKAVHTVREEWLPAFEDRLRDAVGPYENRSPPAATNDAEDTSQAGSAGTAAAPSAGTSSEGTQGGKSTDRRAGRGDIRVVPREDGGFRVRLPSEGIMVSPEGDHYRVTAGSESADKRRDLTATVTHAMGRLTENTEEYALAALKTVQSVGQAIVKGVFTFVIMLMLSAYMLVTSDRILGFVRSLVRPDRRDGFERLLRRIDRGLAGVVRGQLLICLVNGVLTGIGLYLFDIAYWPILTLVAAVLSVIPIFGAIISTIPAVILALQEGFGTALLVLAWIVGIHQLEANVLNPKIMGDAAKVHPVLIIFALLAGEHLYGIAGALLAVPVLSVVQSLFLHFREIALGSPEAAPSPATAGGPAPPAEPERSTLGARAEDSRG